MHSFANLVALVNQYTILDDGVTKVYSYNTYSNGSGIYFQLSRRIQFKNWKDKVKKNDLGLPQM